MLNIYPSPERGAPAVPAPDAGSHAAAAGSTTLPPTAEGVAWIDLLEPTDSEIAFVESSTGLRVPRREALREIESSSRNYMEGGAVYLSTPLIARAFSPEGALTPVGFVFNHKILITIRYNAFVAFDIVAEQSRSQPDLTAEEALVRLLESVVDKGADLLERIGEELDKVSHGAFHTDQTKGKAKNLSAATEQLRHALRRIGQMGDRTSQIRDSLLGVGRITGYLSETACQDWPQPLKQRMGAIRGDIFAERLRGASGQQGPVPARRHLGFHQHRAERYRQGTDDRLHCRSTAGVLCGGMGHELPQYSRIRLELWLSFRLGRDDPKRHRAARLVQMAGVDVSARTILVFGKSGQVAQELARAKLPQGWTLEFAGRERCDLLKDDPAVLIRSLAPAAVINASAHTAVDKAESEPDAAFRLNRDAPAAMARACAEHGIPFVHLSTDYVFDGAKPTPYTETDPIAPLGVYGASKAEGEAAVREAGGAWTIFRTAWVFSPFGANFIKTMRRFAAERDTMSVVDDQWGRPTLAADIASICIEAIRRGLAGDTSLQGLFNLAGAEDAVWADIAERVFEDTLSRTGRRPTLARIPTSAYPTPAKRPANSRLDTKKLQAAAQWSPRPWRDSVDICLAELAHAEP